jgi:hypothetical protein
LDRGVLEEMPSWRRPSPFKEPEYSFSSLEEAWVWFGDAEIRDAG